jgi:hypothetical protein
VGEHPLWRAGEGGGMEGSLTGHHLCPLFRKRCRALALATALQGCS